MRLRQYLGRFRLNSKKYTFFYLVLAATVLVNVVQFGAIEDRINGNWNAIREWKTSVMTQQPGAKARYESFVAIARFAPDATLYAPKSEEPNPSGSPSYRHRVYGVGRISDMQKRNYNPEAFLADLNIDDHVLAQSEKFVLAGESTPIKHLVLTIRGDRTVYIDFRMLTPEQRKVLEP